MPFIATNNGKQLISYILWEYGVSITDILKAHHSAQDKKNPSNRISKFPRLFLCSDHKYLVFLLVSFLVGFNFRWVFLFESLILDFKASWETIFNPLSVGSSGVLEF